MDATNAVAANATREIIAWLTNRAETIRVENVEADPRYQKMDVDLIWVTREGARQIEIKADRYHRTGNFFFETASNRERNTPGCFLYTQADWLFYYFVAPRTLYILPVRETREWFLQNCDRFQERATTTPVGDARYTTVGKLVPIAEVLRVVARIRVEQI
ncbi:MAG: hypothetical protein HZC40_12000 [Chloroflexi bacterium]|nr:hypothetical protein [Chloroflexota bacterium]